MIVLPAFPFYTVLLCHLHVYFSYPRPLKSTELLNGIMRGHRLFEPELIHLPDYFQPGFFVESEFRLVEQAICPRTSRLSRRIETNTRLPNPDKQTTDTGGENNCCMRDPVPGSSMRHATLPIGIWVRTPFLSTSTNAPSVHQVHPSQEKQGRSSP